MTTVKELKLYLAGCIVIFFLSGFLGIFALYFYNISIAPLFFIFGFSLAAIPICCYEIYTKIKK